MIILPNSFKVDLNSFERILDESLSASYKIFWFSGIFKELIMEKKQMSFRRVVCRMVIGAWYPVTQYKLHLGVQDRLFDLVILIHEKYKIPVDIKENELLDFLEGINDVEIEKRIKTLSDYVPYRLLTPFFAKELAKTRDIWSKNDSKKHKFISELTNIDDKAIYKIDMVNKTIEVYDNWYNYLYTNQSIVYGWINYKLICYLQKRNPNVPAIPFKLTAPLKRDLSSAKKLWKAITQDKCIRDIYTGKSLVTENYMMHGDLSIDHFIPWSFVLHDELWNLVPTFKNINSSKSNKLPEIKKFMGKFCEIQYEAFDIMQKNPKKYKSNLEEYTSINLIANGERLIYKEEFNNIIKDTIEPLYQIAQNQGYDIWYR